MLEGSFGSSSRASLLGAGHGQRRWIEQTELHQHGRLVPIDVLMRDLVVLIEANDHYGGNRHFAPGWFDARQNRRHLAIVGEREDQLVDQLALASRARDQRDLGVFRPMADEPGLIEAAHRVRPVAAGHDGHVGDMRGFAHRGHGRLDIARLELGCGVGVEHFAEGFAFPRHRFFSRFTFASITSQIMAAMSGPPNCATWRMPVGEVTLISVR